MHILGLHNGTLGGNSEILLKAAILAAQSSDSNITASMIHIPSVSMPINAGALLSAMDISGGLQMMAGAANIETIDDRQEVLDAILSADAIIISSPVYSHQPRGTLKTVLDSILGPFADASQARRANTEKKAGNPKYKDAVIDERLFKPKIAAFMAVAGSAEHLLDQWTMALPTMHMFVYCLHAKVVDQTVFPGNISSGSVLLKEEKTLSRAEQLGKNVATQIGKPFDEAQYLGEEEEGSCPYCHLLKIEFRVVNGVRCNVCGAEGELIVGDNGKIRPVWEKDSSVSSITLKGKWKHLDDIMGGVQREKPLMHTVKESLQRWRDIEIDEVPLPSHVHRNNASMI